MGALTKGDRRAADATDMSAFDLDNVYGRQALRRSLARIYAETDQGRARRTPTLTL